MSTLVLVAVFWVTAFITDLVNYKKFLNSLSPFFTPEECKEIRDALYPTTLIGYLFRFLVAFILAPITVIASIVISQRFKIDILKESLRKELPHLSKDLDLWAEANRHK